MSASAAALAPAPNLPRAFAFGMVEVVLFTAMVALVKTLGTGYPLMQIVFCRAVFALIPLAPVLLIEGGVAAMRTSRLGGHALRIMIGVCATSAMYYAYARLPLADAVAISFTSPLFVTAFSMPLLGERVGLGRALAIVIGFLGVLVIVRPSGEVDLGPALIAILGNGLIALTLILVRRLGRTERSVTTVFYYSTGCALVGACFMPFQWRQPEGNDLLLLAAIGVCGGLAHLFLTQAYRLAPVAVVAPFDYLAIFWAALFGYVLWGERPDVNLLIGAPVVIAAGLYIVLGASGMPPQPEDTIAAAKTPPQA